MPLTDREIKEAALVGLRHQKAQIEEKIGQLERELRGAGGEPAPEPAKKRVLSEEARNRIAAAQRKRWAAAKAAVKQAEAAPKKKSAAPAKAAQKKAPVKKKAKRAVKSPAKVAAPVEQAPAQA